MNICNVIKQYQNGDYKYCAQIFCDNSSSSDLVLSNGNEKDHLKLISINEIARRFLYENNAAVCRAMQYSEDEKKWSESISCFTRLYSNYKSLLVIPLELEMIVVYNMLWWYWIKPESIQYTSLHFTTILKCLSSCLVKVLKSCGEMVLGQELCSYDVLSVVHLLKQTSDQLLCLKPVACMQLLDIITMTVQVLLRQRESEVVANCMSMMRKAIDQLELLRLHTQREVTPGNEEVYFKFGLKRVNSTASLKNCGDSIDAFVVTGSLVCAINREYEHAMGCLKGITDGENASNFMVNYLKAYSCLLSHHLSEAKLCLAYVMSSPLPPPQLAHYRLLLARLLSEQGNHQAALLQCDAFLASNSSRLCSLAAHLAAQQAERLSLSTAQLNYLRQHVQYLKLNSVDDGQFESFEECCLTVLSHQFSITLPEALYTLARQMYLTGYHVKALDSYNELLELVKSHVLEVSSLMPSRSQILQESALAHIKANSLPGGEKLCRQLVQGHVPHSGGPLASGSLWEAALYSMDDDVVGLLLLADILAVSDKRKALEELNRCTNAVTEWQEQARTETETELCDWLLSRIMLRKAKLSGIKDAAHCFRRALLHKPGDKEVMFHYKQWALWHPDHESFDPGDAGTAVVFPTEQIHNLAMRHVLGCGISEEEWGALFDQESSQNVIESLFEDDDE